MGDGKLGVATAETTAWTSARRSMVAEKAIKANDIINSDMIGMKRPGGGLSPSMIDSVLGKKALCDIKPDEQISLDMLD